MNLPHVWHTRRWFIVRDKRFWLYLNPFGCHFGGWRV